MLQNAAEEILLFGQRLKALRKKQKLTQSDLGRGFATASMISQIESGRVVPSRELLLKIIQRLGADAEDFATLESSDTSVTALRQFRMLIKANQYAGALAIAHAHDFTHIVDEDTLASFMALCYEQTAQLDLAVPLTERRVFLALGRQDYASAMHLYYELGSMCKRWGRPHLAYMYWRRGAGLYERLPIRTTPPFASKLYAALARSARDLKDGRRALVYYQRAVEKSDETFGSAFELALLLRELAVEQFYAGDYENAFHSSEKAKTLFLRVRSRRGENECKLLLARIHRLKGDAASCRGVLQEVVEQGDECALKPSSIAEVHFELCIACFELGDTPSALEQMRKAARLDGSLSLKCQIAITVLNLAQAANWREHLTASLYADVLQKLKLSGVGPTPDSREDWQQLLQLFHTLRDHSKAENAHELLEEIAHRVSRCLQSASI